MSEAESEPLAVIGEFDLEVLEVWRGEVLNGHNDVPVAGPQVEIRISQCMHETASSCAGPGAGLGGRAL